MQVMPRTYDDLRKQLELGADPTRRLTISPLAPPTYSRFIGAMAIPECSPPTTPRGPL